MNELMFTLFICLFVSVTHCLSPIVFVPGWTISPVRFDVHTSEPVLPGCPTDITFYSNAYPTKNVSTDCLMAWMNVDVTINPEDNTITESPPTGVTYTTTNSTDVYQPLLSSFYQAGWVVNETLFVQNWDWRLSPNGQPFVEELVTLIEHAYTSNNNKQVFIMGHSSGPRMIYYFLMQMTQEWKNQYLSGFVVLAGAVAGQAFMLAHDLEGTGGVPWDGEYAPKYRSIVNTWMNIPFKYPVPNRFLSQVITQTPSKNYTAADIPAVLAAANLTLALDGYQVMQKSQPNAFPTHPGVNITCFWGYGYPSAVGGVYATDDLSKMPVAQIYLDGDNTHDWITNSACTEWNSTAGYSFFGRGYANVTHDGITTQPEVLSYLFKLMG